jgi:hypothetical protein
LLLAAADGLVVAAADGLVIVATVISASAVIGFFCQ